MFYVKIRMGVLGLSQKIILKYREFRGNLTSLGTFSKPRRQRQRERGKTKGLMSRTMALHVHNQTLYIS